MFEVRRLPGKLKSGFGEYVQYKHIPHFDIQLLWPKINSNNFNFSFSVPSSEYSIVSLNSTFLGFHRNLLSPF
jgi:hypothetical protein